MTKVETLFHIKSNQVCPVCQCVVVSILSALWCFSLRTWCVDESGVACQAGSLRMIVLG